MDPFIQLFDVPDFMDDEADEILRIAMSTVSRPSQRRDLTCQIVAVAAHWRREIAKTKALVHHFVALREQWETDSKAWTVEERDGTETEMKRERTAAMAESCLKAWENCFRASLTNTFRIMRLAGLMDENTETTDARSQTAMEQSLKGFQDDLDELCFLIVSGQAMQLH